MSDSAAVSPSATRAMKIVAVLAAISTLAAVVWSSSLPLWLGLRVYSEQVLLIVLSCSMAITLMTRPRRRGSSRPPDRFDHGVALVALIWGAVMVIRFPVLSQNVFYHPTEALILSSVGIVLLLETVRRSMGWALIVILGLVVLYALFSSNLSGPMQSRSIRWDRLLTFMVLDSASLAGAALYIAVAVVVPFLILAQLLLQTGGSAFFSDLSLALAGRKRGGAGKIAILGSALFGSVSGSAVSNVASTGAITIPLMKDGGYRPRTAAAIEASASTGGQLMPPIMGASAFLLAENLQVAYGEVVLAALIPSILFYVALYIFADLEAGRRGIASVEPSRIPAMAGVMAKGWFVVVPFAVLLGGLFVLNMRPETAALYAVLSLFVLSLFKTYEGGRIKASALVEAIVKAGRSAVEVVLICAIAGIIIGLFSRSGLSFGMGFFLVKLGEGSLILLLLVTAAVCILMGMGLPTVGVYLLLSTLAAPPLIELGLNPMSAHLFVLYFGMLSMLTPPVAIAAFVAANMAGAPPMRTGLEAVRIAWPAFVVPFLFVASPALLFDGAWWQVVLALGTALVGVYFVTAGVVGFLWGTVGPFARLALITCGAAALWPPGAPMAFGVMAVGLAGCALLVVLLRPGVRPGQAAG
ncbi:TRAP transporter fused permease subunit [Cognatishimia sp. F0-27]|uniref:TRAP transporter permease n=1 Tax=Cognatishimia sp. F0-27 TaxID=2816855 RepID=UPI001D0C8095|nr:TRAP transporter fused permease subunit [Cognatishimia sp. F0-27]MCC1495034.1 TRAP transporter fused permease subunit [Cognatishimia sp. F0-27]